MAYQRKTHAEWNIQGYYGRQYGWETVTTELSWREAQDRLHEYRENEPEYPHRVRLNSRVPNTEPEAAHDATHD